MDNNEHHQENYSEFVDPILNDHAEQSTNSDENKGFSPILIGILIILIILIFLYIARKTSNKSKMLKTIKENEIKRQQLSKENEYDLLNEVDDFLIKQKQYINGK